MSDTSGWPRLIRAARQPGWAVLDQGIYSGTNFAATIFVARILGPRDFGIYSIVLGLWFAAWSLIRSTIAEPFVIRASTLSRDQWEDHFAHATGAVFAIGVGIALLAAGGAMLFLDGDSRSVLLTLAIFVPFLLLQDFYRVAAFSRARGGLAVLNDSAWATVQFAALLLLWSSDAFSATNALTAWAVGGLAGCAVGFVQFRLFPRFDRETLGWTRRTLSLGGWFGGVQVIQSISGQIVLVLVGVTVGVAGAGGLRGTSTLFGPLATLYRAIELSALPALVKRVPDGLGRVVLLYAAAVASVALVYGSAVVLGDSRLLRLVFGSAFVEFTPLLLPLAIVSVTVAVVSPLSVGLRAQRVGQSLVAAEVVNSTLRIGLVAVGLFLIGLNGVPWAIATSSLINATLLAVIFRRSLRARALGN